MRSADPTHKMKRSFSAVFLIAVLFITMQLPVFARNFTDDEHFSMDIPDEYEKAESSLVNYVFTAPNGDNFNVTVAENEESVSIVRMNKNDVREKAESLKAEAVEAFGSAGAGVNIEILSSEKVKLESKLSALKIKLKNTFIASDGKIKDKYQCVFLIAGKENLFTFTFSTDTEEALENAGKIMDTVTINEKQLVISAGSVISSIAAAVIVTLISYGIIKFIRPRKK